VFHSAFCLTFGYLVGKLWVSPLSGVLSLKNRIALTTLRSSTRLGWKIERSSALSAEFAVDSMPILVGFHFFGEPFLSFFSLLVR